MPNFVGASTVLAHGQHTNRPQPSLSVLARVSADMWLLPTGAAAVAAEQVALAHAGLQQLGRCTSCCNLTVRVVQGRTAQCWVVVSAVQFMLLLAGLSACFVNNDADHQSAAAGVQSREPRAGPHPYSHTEAHGVADAAVGVCPHLLCCGLCPHLLVCPRLLCCVLWWLCRCKVVKAACMLVQGSTPPIQRHIPFCCRSGCC